MDQEVLRARLKAQFEASLDAALQVESAPDGRWIAGSEGPVRDIFTHGVLPALAAIKTLSRTCP